MLRESCSSSSSSSSRSSQIARQLASPKKVPRTLVHRSILPFLLLTSQYFPLFLLLSSCLLLVFLQSCLVFLSLLQVSSKSLLVFSRVFWRIHVSLSGPYFLSVSTPFFYVSVFVLFGLLQSQLVSFRLLQSCASLSWSPSGVPQASRGHFWTKTEKRNFYQQNVFFCHAGSGELLLLLLQREESTSREET